jgi:predicted amidohydrolase
LPSPLHPGFSFFKKGAMKLRVASLQFKISPCESFDHFRSHVADHVASAAEYRAKLLVFPEYFSIGLLHTGVLSLPMHDQIRRLALDYAAPSLQLFQELARKHNLFIAAGTVPVLNGETQNIESHCHLVAPSGQSFAQGKLHMTRFESEDWIVHAARGLKVIETPFAKVAIAICYDVEFPELVRAAVHQGARILIVPSCTDDRQGWLRVRYCAQARTVENQIYVIHSSTVGGLPRVPSCALNYGQASLLSPSDYAFARDGILAEGQANHEMMIVGELDMEALENSHENGTVLPLRDSLRTPEIVKDVELLALH